MVFPNPISSPSNTRRCVRQTARLRLMQVQIDLSKRSTQELFGLPGNFIEHMFTLLGIAHFSEKSDGVVIASHFVV
jgi:hypothetical protein